MNDSLARPAAPTSRQKLGSLEIGRFLAASFVVLSHLLPFVQKYGAPDRPVFNGWLSPSPLGVEYFFVLSGFVMACAHLDDFGRFASIPKFWWRRACRIYPVYWLALCIPLYFLWHSLTLSAALHLFLLDPWNTAPEYVPPAWTLRYEMAFYIALGLCMIPYAGRVLLVLWIGMTVWSHMPLGLLVFMHSGPPFFPNHVFAAIGPNFGSVFEFHFFSGLAAGWVFTRRRPGAALSWAISALGAALLLYWLPGCHWGTDYGQTALYTIPLTIGLACIILGLAGLEVHGILRLDKLIGGKTAAWLGAMSYPLYMLHAPMMLVVSGQLPALHLPPAGQYAFCAASLLAVYAAAAAVTFGFDQPVQRLLRQVTPARWQIRISGAVQPQTR